MKIKFWGVRGSIPVPGPATVRYGGNTACIEVMGHQGQCIILEAGTGLRPLGLDLVKRGKPLPSISIFISHTHWDHIQGFPFFVPNYIPGTKIQVKGPVHFVENKSLQSVFEMQMRYEFFPISNEQLGAQIEYDTLKEIDFDLGPIHIKSQFTNHPILTLGYRLTENGRSIVYTGDHEPYHNLFKDPAKESVSTKEDDLLFGDIDQTVDQANQRFVEFIRKAQVLVIDCQYTPEEYRTSKKNWGHSSWDYCLRWMQEGEVERMIFTHHEPLRSDESLDQMLAEARQAAAAQGIDPQRISMAIEGMEVEV